MLFSIIASTAVWILIALFIIRVVYSSGCPANASDDKIIKLALAPNMRGKGYTPANKDYVRVAVYAAIFRIVVFLISIMIMRFYIDGSEPLTMDRFLSEWEKWDANNYIRIASLGYSGYQEEGMYTTLVFFPLYSWVMKLFYSLVLDMRAAGLIVSTLCYIAGCCFFYGAIALDYGKNVAERAVILISVFPFSMFFGTIFPESIFFMLCAICIFYLRRQNWAIASVAGMLASLSRMQGIILLVVIFIEWCEFYKPIELIRTKKTNELIKAVFTKLSWILLVPVGLLVYFYINYSVSGDAFKFLEYQEKVWNNGSQYFGETFITIWDKACGVKASGQLIFTSGIVPVFLLVLSIAVMFYCYRKVHNKYLVFMLLYTIMCYVLKDLISAGRYISVSFPLFLGLAVFLEEHPKAEKITIVLSSVMFGAVLYAYLTFKHIL